MLLDSSKYIPYRPRKTGSEGNNHAKNELSIHIPSITSQATHNKSNPKLEEHGET
jgi:hypothetical protein